jgi:drug/metabolite transporter (DMT)-like permease
MFLGEALCFLGYLVVRWRAIRKKALWVGEVNLSKSHKLPAGLTEEDIQVAEAPLFDWVLPLPAMLDLIGSSLSGVGLLFIPPSVWQMLRGSLIVFSAILSVIFLKRKLVLLHWIGIALVVVGLGTVGTSSLLNSAGSADSSLWFGIGIVMVGQLVSSIQLIVEEILLKNRSLHPLHVVGLEGVSGILMLSTLVLPIMYYIPGTSTLFFFPFFFLFYLRLVRKQLMEVLFGFRR